jgi:geranylgeranyl pyrophosphate synthase
MTLMMTTTITTKTKIFQTMTMSNKDLILPSSVKTWRETKIGLINSSLAKTISRLSENQPPEIVRLLKAMEHILLSGGKRLRPLLTLATSECVGGHDSLALPGALAIEMIHAYSLIHDDLPALDDDDLRRGLPSCHITFGEATAILAGDGLQSLAFQTLGTFKPKSLNKPQPGLFKAYNILSQAIGPLGMVGGQVMDLAFEEKQVSLSDSLDMARRKTGELMGAAMGIGASLGGATNYNINTLTTAGLLAGQAFQITDDLLNLEGDSALMGKATGTDVQRGKTSYLSLTGPEEARTLAKNLSFKALKIVSGFNSPQLTWLINSLVKRVC